MKLLVIVFIVVVAFGLVRRENGTWEDYLSVVILALLATFGIMLL